MDVLVTMTVMTRLERRMTKCAFVHHLLSFQFVLLAMGGDNGDKSKRIENFEIIRHGDASWTTISQSLPVWHPFAVTINDIVYINGRF